MSLYTDIARFLSNTNLNPLHPQLYLGNHWMRALLWNERILIGNQTHTPTKTNGWQFHFSVDQRDLDKAFDIVADVMEQHQGGCFSVATEFQASVIASRSALANPERRDPLHMQKGRVITLPHTLVKEGETMVPRRDMKKILQEIEARFAKEHLRPGPTVLGARQLPGQGYCWMCPENLAVAYDGSIPDIYKHYKLSYPSPEFFKGFDFHNAMSGTVIRKEVQLTDDEYYTIHTMLRSFGINTHYEGRFLTIPNDVERSTDRFSEIKIRANSAVSRLQEERAGENDGKGGSLGA